MVERKGNGVRRKKLRRHYTLEELDQLWSDLIGSRRIFASQEVGAIKDLIRTGAISAHAGYELYLTSKHWKRLRYSVLRRDEFRCVLCKSKDKLQIDHVSYGELGEDTVNNLQTLCWHCHANKTKRFDLRGNRTIAKSKANVTMNGQLYAVLR